MRVKASCHGFQSGLFSCSVFFMIPALCVCVCMMYPHWSTVFYCSSSALSDRSPWFLFSPSFRAALIAPSLSPGLSDRSPWYLFIPSFQLPSLLSLLSRPSCQIPLVLIHSKLYSCPHCSLSCPGLSVRSPWFLFTPAFQLPSLLFLLSRLFCQIPLILILSKL